MRKAFRLAALFTSLAALPILTSRFAMAQEKEQVIKVGKNGNITLSQETMVGDVKLPAGDYQVKHRVEGSDHMIHFKQLYSQRTGAVIAHPGDIKCKLEPLNQKVAQTAVFLNKEDGMMRITRIEIGGENVAHLF